MIPDGMHLRVLKEVSADCEAAVGCILKAMAIKGASDHWKKTNITLIFKNSKREDPDNYRLANLISIL